MSSSDPLDRAASRAAPGQRAAPGERPVPGRPAEPGPHSPLASRRRLLRSAALVGAVAGAGAGCGFHLRGTADLPFRTLYVNAPAGSQIADLFRREVTRRTTTKLVSRPADAQVVLNFLGENREKDIVAYSGVGRPRLFELRSRLSFSATNGGEIEYIPPSEIVLRRDVSAAENQLTARVDEEVLLFRDMQQEMVDQLLRRLAAIRLDAPKAR